jgi:hypothetical protein
VNSPAGQRLGLAPIPGDRLNMRMLRRRLAIELAYRPGGLLATKIHLRHVTAATTEGYAFRPGGAQAELLAEVSEHEQQRNLDLVLAEFRNYQDGVLPAGPGARELTDRLKNDIATLRQRLARRDETINELTDFRTEALSRLAAQHEETTRVREALERAGNIRRLPIPTSNRN